MRSTALLCLGIFAAPVNVQALPGGRVLVNDVVNRKGERA
jgi:hypothetical protein